MQPAGEGCGHVSACCTAVGAVWGRDRGGHSSHCPLTLSVTRADCQPVARPAQFGVTLRCHFTLLTSHRLENTAPVGWALNANNYSHFSPFPSHRFHTFRFLFFFVFSNTTTTTTPTTSAAITTTIGRTAFDTPWSIDMNRHTHWPAQRAARLVYTLTGQKCGGALGTVPARRNPSITALIAWRKAEHGIKQSIRALIA